MKLEERHCHRRVLEIERALLQGSDHVCRQGVQIDFEPQRQRRVRAHLGEGLMQLEGIAPEGFIAEGVKAKDLPPSSKSRCACWLTSWSKWRAVRRSEGSGRGRAVQAREGQRAKRGEREKGESQDQRLVLRTRRSHGLLLGGKRGGSLEGNVTQRSPPDARRVCRRWTRSAHAGAQAFARPRRLVIEDACTGESIPEPVFFRSARPCGTGSPQKKHASDLLQAVARRKPDAGGGTGSTAGEHGSRNARS